MSYEQFAYAYDRLMADMPYPQWVAYAKRKWAQAGLTPRKIVDLACGTGNISVPLALMGYDVIGIDLSEQMLSVAEHKTQHTVLPSGGSLSWFQGDLRDWSIGEEVDAVVSFCDSINYLLEESDIKDAFHAVYAALRPGGLFLFDVHMPQQLVTYAATQPFIYNEDDISYIWTCELDEERMEIQHDLSIFVVEEGSRLYRKIEETHVQRAYPLQWLKEQLRIAGFTDIDETADFEERSPDVGAQRAFFSVRKR
jgi:ubiquinone/menaquinone biosynthesis C-methylase UbiE